jgi:hypothetical protein
MRRMRRVWASAIAATDLARLYHDTRPASPAGGGMGAREGCAWVERANAASLLLDPRRAESLNQRRTTVKKKKAAKGKRLKKATKISARKSLRQIGTGIGGRALNPQPLPP